MKTRCPHCGKEIEFDDAILLALIEAEAARVLGARGGSVTGEAKRRAAIARNARRKAEGKPEGGRPRKID